MNKNNTIYFEFRLLDLDSCRGLSKGNAAIQTKVGRPWDPDDLHVDFSF
jgi:hypothetical protein